MVPDEYIQRLTENSNKKMKFLKEYFVLTQNQTKAINEEDIEKLNALIEEKQERLDEIGKIDDEFNIYFQRLKQTLKVSNLEEIKDQNIKGVKELQNIVGSVMGSIKEIRELEKQNNNTAKNILDTIGSEIIKMNQGKKVNMAYNPPPIGQSPSYFIDKKK